MGDNIIGRSATRPKARRGRWGRLRRPGAALVAVALATSATVLLGAPSSNAAPGDINTIVGGPGHGTAKSLSVQPNGVTFSGSDIMIADEAAALRKVSGSTMTVADQLPLTDSAYQSVVAHPAGLIVSREGPATDAGVFLIRPDGTEVRLVAGTPRGLGVHPDGDVYFASGNKVSRFALAADGTLGSTFVVAGQTTFGSTGDGGPAISAALKAPGDVAVGADGRIFIADTGNHRIRVIDTTGIITTFAGTGAAGFTGDGAQAAAARLSSPGGVAAIGDGRILIADTDNNRIRVVAKDGLISTFAGTGGVTDPVESLAPTQVSIDSPTEIEVTAGTLAIASRRYVQTIGITSLSVRVRAGNGLDSFGGDGLPASGAQLNDPYDSVHAPDGSIYISDRGNNRLRRVKPDGTITSVANLNAPEALAVDAAGKVLIVTAVGIKRYDPVTGAVSTFDGLTSPTIGRARIAPDPTSPNTVWFANGDTCVQERPFRTVAPPSRSWCLPAGAADIQTIAADPRNGEIVVLDRSGRLWRINPTTGAARTVKVGLFGADGRDNEDSDVAVSPTGVVYVSVQQPCGGVFFEGPNTVMRIPLAGSATLFAGVVEAPGGCGSPSFFCGDGGQAKQACFRKITGLDVDANLDLLITDGGNDRLRKVQGTTAAGEAATTTTSTTSTTPPPEPAPLVEPAGVAVPTAVAPQLTG